jgi:hypothetical protein
LASASSENVAAIVTIPQEIAWRVFTRGIDRGDALVQSTLAGRRELALPVFDLTAIIA